MNLSDKKTIMPFVSLYRNVFDDIDGLLNSIKDPNGSRILLEWEPWYELGLRTQMRVSGDHDLSENEATHLEIHNLVNDTLIAGYKDYISEWAKPEIIKNHINPNSNFHEDWKYVFGEFVKDWQNFDRFEGVNGEKEGWMLGAVEFLKHDHEIEGLELAIGYHLDAFNSKDAAGPKAIITGTIYLNDDYEGGEISFLNEFDSSIVNFKPQKGDMIIFPSAKPFFHAAQPLTGKDKYLIRNFLLWYHSGSERYRQGQEKFGKEQWEVMQEVVRETEDLLGLYQKDVYLPGISVFDRQHGNGVPFFAKSVRTWSE